MVTCTRFTLHQELCRLCSIGYACSNLCSFHRTPSCMSFPLARVTSTYSASFDATDMKLETLTPRWLSLTSENSMSCPAPWPNTQLVSSFVSCCSLQEAGRGGHCTAARWLVVTFVGHEISGTSESTVHHHCQPYTLQLEVEEGRENRAHTHSTSTSVGRSSAEEIAKLNSLNFTELQ